jgi:hypothetical protein
MAPTGAVFRCDSGMAHLGRGAVLLSGLAQTIELNSSTKIIAGSCCFITGCGDYSTLKSSECGGLLTPPEEKTWVCIVSSQDES